MDLAGHRPVHAEVAVLVPAAWDEEQILATVGRLEPVWEWYEDDDIDIGNITLRH